MKIAELWRSFHFKLPWIYAIAARLLIGFGLGWFIAFASTVNHPISQVPIPVEFCFWVSHPDLFRGQPVETEAKYTQLIEGGAIDKEACENLDISNYWSQTVDPVRDKWEKDLANNFFTAQFELTFVGTIPAYPRYVYWLDSARNQWRPMHHITTLRVDRLISFKRLQ